MAYINYDIEKNFYEILRGYYYKESGFDEEKISNEISILNEESNIKGIRLYNIFNNNELKGAKAEEFIKNFLEDNHIPFLYIGQGPVGVQYSSILKNDLEAHRPDFLVRLQDVGTIFFDVKCRSPRGFNEKDKLRYFALNRDEVETLINLNQELLIPVWIAFVDSDFTSQPKPSFYILSVSQLKSFYEGLKNNLSKREHKALASIRIPYEILQEISDKLEINLGASKIQQEIIMSFSERYKELIRRIEDEVRSFIRKNTTYRSKIAQEMIYEKGRMPFLIDKEVKSIVDLLIEEEIILYVKGKSLKLKGE